MIPGIDALCAEWLSAKNAEAVAVERRRNAENSLIELLGVDEKVEGTVTSHAVGYTVKTVSRLTRKVDADALQALACEHGISEHLSVLFRWKPEIDAAKWKSAAPTITSLLLPAITTTSGRPSFAITTKDK